MNNKWSLRRKIITGIIVTVVICGLVVGVVAVAAYTQRGSVIVIPVSEVDYGYMGESASTIDGTVTFGNSHTVVADPSKPVTELLVKKGDKVKKGDVIARYDSTSAKANLDQRNLDVTSIQTQIDGAQAKLNLLNSVTAKQVPDTSASQPVTRPAPNGDNEADPDGLDDTRPIQQQPVRMRTEYTDSQGNKYDDMADVRKAKNEQTATLRELHTNLEEAQMNVERAKQAVADCDIMATMDGVVTIADPGKVSTPSAAPADNTAQPAGEKEENAVEGTGSVEEIEDGEDIEDEEEEELDDEDLSESDSENVVVQVSALEGLFVSSYISEWTKAEKNIGSTIYIKSWESGVSCEAEITDISPYASEEYAQMVAEAGLNVSYYPMTAKITTGGDSLHAGESVEVTFNAPADTENEDGDEVISEDFEEDAEELSEEGVTSEDLEDTTGDVVEEAEEDIEDEEALSEEDEEFAEDEEDLDYEDEEEASLGKIYLWKAFVLVENGTKYAYVRGKDKKLEKRKLTVAGQETETYIVTGGLSEDDYIAFPYGDSVREGAETREGSTDDLYSE